jgi:hypothetical protein
MIGKSNTHLFAPRKGTPAAKSSPKISSIKAATTIPNMHNALGMGLSLSGTLAVVSKWAVGHPMIFCINHSISATLV